MIRVVSAELFKLGKRPAVWTLVGVWLVLGLTFAYVFPYLSYRTGTPTGPNAGAVPAQLLAGMLPANLVSAVLAGYPLFGGAVVLILGALVTGGEYGFGTVKTLFTQRPRRLEVFGGIVGALLAIVLVLGIANFALAAGASSVIAATESAPGAFPPAADLLRGLASGWLILGMWGLLGLLAGIVFRGTTLAVGLGLVWALVIENLIHGFASLLGAIDALQRALPGVNAGSLVAALASPGARSAPGVAPVVGATQAVVVLACYAVGFVLVAGALVARRDVT